jgi:uncharacterized damage-inducible protein DinB
MYRNVDDFLKAYENLIESTTRVFALLTDEQMSKPAGQDHRSPGQLAWHIVTSLAEMMSRTGLSLSTVNHESLPPQTAEDIKKAYRETSSELLEAIKSGWTDETLLQTDDLYGQTWARGMTLSVLVNHEIHHRAQMIMLLRQAGSAVPGVCGPAREEWSAYGMETPPY